MARKEETELTLVAVVMERPRARCFSGKISPVTTCLGSVLSAPLMSGGDLWHVDAQDLLRKLTQANGPQVEAKKNMYMQTKAIPAFWAATLYTRMLPWLSWPVVKVPNMATRNWDTHMPTAPQNRRGRRPHLSMAYSPGIVETTFIEDVIIWIAKALETPEFLK